MQINNLIIKKEFFAKKHIFSHTIEIICNFAHSKMKINIKQQLKTH